ncbi:MAG: HAD hydrolase-like protein [Elusimicrobia bacterium]|nr:HAD hydrolase-like protein [Elusimicrobiota bacterium]
MHISAWKEALKNAGVSDEGMIEKLLDDGCSSEQIARRLGAPGETPGDPAARKREIFSREFKADGRLFAGVPALVKKLYLRGYGLAIATTHSSGLLKAVLDREGIACFFSAVLEAPLVKKKIVDKKTLERTFGEKNIPLDNSVYVGDSSSDIRFADVLGMPCILVRGHYRDPDAPKNADLIINEIDDLADLFRSRRAGMEAGAEIVRGRIRALAGTGDKTVIGVSGGTASGKGHLCSALAGEVLSLDGYYRDKEELDGMGLDFYEPGAQRLDCAVGDIRKWLEGKEVQVPVYDIKKYRRSGYRVIGKGSILIVEGLFGLMPPVLELVDYGVFVDSPEETRLNRKIDRGISEGRGRAAGRTRERFRDIVRPMHIKYIEPQKGNADFIIENPAFPA